MSAKIDDMDQLDSELLEIGLSAVEVRVYRALFEAGSATAQVVATKATLPRSTVYGALDLLKERGLISVSGAPRRQRFVMNEPSALLEMLSKEAARTEKRRQTATGLISMLAPQFKKCAWQPTRVNYAEGKKEVERLLYQFRPLWQASYRRLNHFTMWGYQDHTFVQEYKKWHEVAWTNRDPKQQIRLFSNKEGIAQQRAEMISGREIRLLPVGIEFASSIWIHGEYIVLGATREQPHYAVIMWDPILAKNQRAIFQFLWQATEPDSKKLGMLPTESQESR